MTTYIQLAQHKLDNKEFDKSKIYLDKTALIIEKYNLNYLFSFYEKYGNYYNALGDRKKAEELYELALRNALSLKDMDASKYYYKLILDFLNKNKINKIKSTQYLIKYNNLNDSLNVVNKNVLDDIYDKIEIDNEIKQHEQTSNYEIFICIVLFFSLIIIIIFFFKKKKYKTLILNSHQEINNNKNKIKSLKEDVNDARHKELRDLADLNAPNFYLHFQELYPEVVLKIRKIDPNSNPSEINFLALAHLNYSTKDLAKIFNVSIRAIQIRKNRIRKKYNLSSKINFNLWYYH